MSKMTTTGKVRRFYETKKGIIVRREKTLPPAHLFFLPCDCSLYTVHNGMNFRHKSICSENVKPSRGLMFKWDTEKYAAESEWIKVFNKSKS